MEQAMSAEIPIDPSMPNPQDPKDASRAHGVGGGFMSYVPAWEGLSDATTRVMRTTGRTKDSVQSDICKAIADGKVKIRGNLESHKTREGKRAWNTVLQGEDFQIPTEIEPSDLDWEKSRPVEAWFVRREKSRDPGYWFLKWIKVCTDDITKALCAAKQQDDSTRHVSSETPATSTSGPVGPDQRSTAAPQKLGAARRRGARPLKFEQTRNAMTEDIQQGRRTLEGLANMLEKNLTETYNVSRDTARKARNAVLQEFGKP